MTFMNFHNKNDSSSSYLRILINDKFVSQFLPSKRLMWHQALPIILNNINCSVLRTSKLTRRQLFFSPLTYHHSRWITYDPSLTETPINQHHKKAIDALNKIRNANMMRNANIF